MEKTKSPLEEKDSIYWSLMEEEDSSLLSPLEKKDSSLKESNGGIGFYIGILWEEKDSREWRKREFFSKRV
jgi:hypothetical protein